MTIANGTKAALRTALGNRAANLEILTLLNELDIVADAVDVVKIEQTVTLTNAVKADLSTQLPAGAVVLAAASRIDTAVTGDGTGDDGLTKIGIGTAANPDLYGLSSALTAGIKTSLLPDWAVIGSATTVSVYAVDDAGDAVTEKFVAGGVVTVRIVYIAPKSLPDA